MKHPEQLKITSYQDKIIILYYVKSLTRMFHNDSFKD